VAAPDGDAILTALPQPAADQSSPRLLLVVSRDQLGFYRQLASAFEGADHVDTLLDRRSADRRCAAAPRPLDRRCKQRRVATSDEQLRSPGWFVTWRRPPARPRPGTAWAPATPATAEPEARPGATGRWAAVARREAAAGVAAAASETTITPFQRGIDATAASRAREEEGAETDRTEAPAGAGPMRGGRARRSRVMLAGLLGVAVSAAAFFATKGVTSRGRVTVSPPGTGTTSRSAAAPATTTTADARHEPSSAPRRADAPPPAGVLARRAAVRAELRGAFRAWVEATNRGAVPEHMRWYANTLAVFYNRRGVPRSLVRELRARTFAESTRIEVRTSEPEIRIAPDEQAATMVFTKAYRFAGPRQDRRATVVQELRWEKTAAGWRIVGERTLREQVPEQPPAPRP
jgi:hypothetical protein